LPPGNAKDPRVGVFEFSRLRVTSRLWVEPGAHDAGLVLEGLGCCGRSR
jgi:hypothetical protein